MSAHTFALNLSATELATLVTTRRAAGDLSTLAVPIAARLLADQLTPVLAYRRLVADDDRLAPSFLFESVEGGERLGRYSILGAQPTSHVIAKERRVVVRSGGGERVVEDHADPLDAARDLIRGMVLVRPPAKGPRDTLPACVLGGLFGYAAYDSVRYAEPGKLPFSAAPADDRGLADLSFAFFDGVVVFDHVDKLVHVVQLAVVGPKDDAASAHERAAAAIASRIERLSRHARPLPLGAMPAEGLRAEMRSNMTRDEHAAMLSRAAEYIKAGDVFQVVLGQRFERRSRVDPFDVYRALRAVNPSPYMVYMQCSAAPAIGAGGCILVASSPEILCRVERVVAGKDAGLVLTNRPLAGTRRRGGTPEQDAALEAELLADPKERAEHIMLVDLGRNDVGRVSVPGSIALPAMMEVERYSHVMHISSTVTGRLRRGLDCWDALRATLPVGTISGAPKIRAMQIIDELEPHRRGPYGGGIGCVGLDGQMDIALALRTMVVSGDASLWTYHLQASGGIVADSKAEDEFMETVNKSAALARAIDVAEAAFGVSPS